MNIATGQPITAALLRAIYGTDWADWTPTISGGGAATFTSVSGRWRRSGEKTVLFTVQWTVVIAGTGTTSVTWTLPTSPSRLRRWTIAGGHEGGSISRPGIYATTFTGGSGTTLDRIRYNGNTNFQGQNLEANQIYQYTGFYEEA